MRGAAFDTWQINEPFASCYEAIDPLRECEALKEDIRRLGITSEASLLCLLPILGADVTTEPWHARQTDSWKHSATFREVFSAPFGTDPSGELSEERRPLAPSGCSANQCRAA